MMRFSKLLLLPLATLGLAGCQTTANTMWNDVKTFSLSTLEPVTKEEAGTRMVEGMCPEVVVVDDLSFMSEFADGSTRSNQLVSRVLMNGAQTTCSFQRDFVELDIKLSFTGELGAKGRLRPNDKPYVAYPFFVAVTDQERNLLAKEVFSASMTFNRDENSHTYVENLRQLIPIDSQGEANDFVVMIGFQMSEEQLRYNRANMQMIQPEAPQAIMQVRQGGAS